MNRIAIREAVKKTRMLLNFTRRGFLHANLQLLYDCNFFCKLCDFWQPDFQQEPILTVGQVQVISHKLKRIGPLVISIGGGEPLLHPDLPQIATVLARHHFPVMITNGWYITKDNARALWASGIYEISVSLDFADPEKHDRLRGKEGAFDRAVDALKILNASRAYSFQRVNMIATVFKDNLEHIERLIQLCRQLGVTFLVSCYNPWRGVLRSDSKEMDFSGHLLHLKKKYRHFVALRGYLANFSQVVHSGGAGRCYGGKHFLNIDNKGQVSFCIDRLTDPVGNLFVDDLDSILKKLDAQHRKNACNTCWTSCRGPVEMLFYGNRRLANLWDYYQMTRNVGIGVAF